MNQILDTCVFIDYWKGDSAAISVVNSAKANINTYHYSSISSLELWQYQKLGRKEEIEYIALTKFFLNEIPLSTDIAIIAGQWLRPYSRGARRRLLVDALIGASADRISATIVSRNKKDLSKFHADITEY